MNKKLILIASGGHAKVIAQILIQIKNAPEYVVSPSVNEDESKSFFGDGGTYLLSYIFGYLFIKLYNQTNEIYADQIVLLMLFPGLELMRLFIIRLASKKNPFSADRNHLHHLLLKENNFLRVTLITQSLIILPFMFSLLIGFTIWFIFLSLILYSIIIFKYTR